MSTTVSPRQSTYTTASSSRTKPSFLGLVRGELFKIMRQWTNWIMLVLIAGVIILPYLFEFTRTNLAGTIKSDPLHFTYQATEIGLGVLRVFTGFFLLVITARVITLEYQLGTIRVLLSRGVGRLQLFFAKLMAVALVGLVILVGGLILVSLMILFTIGVGSGNFNALQSLTSQFWSDTWIYILTILLNMGVSILLAAAAAAIGRSAAFGLSVALIFFPVDNIGTLIMELAFRLTNNDFWLNVTAYFLGPNLNLMPGVLVNNRLEIIGQAPVYAVDAKGIAHGINVDGTHTLVVALVYAVIFAATAIWLVRSRDVKE